MDRDSQYLTDPRARRIDGWRASLDIFEKHLDKNQETWILATADHDIIFVCFDIKDIPPDSEDGKLLNTLGWHVDHESGGWAMFI